MNEEAGNSNQGEARFFFGSIEARKGAVMVQDGRFIDIIITSGEEWNRMPKDAKPSYRIHVHPGKENREHIMDELAKQVIQRNVVDFHMQNERVKKIPLPGRAG
jgi:hypothetical protein